MPRATSERIFNEVRLQNLAKWASSCTIERMVSIESTIKQPSLKAGHKRLRMKWFRKCMTGDCFYLQTPRDDHQMAREARVKDVFSTAVIVQQEKARAKWLNSGNEFIDD